MTIEDLASSIAEVKKDTAEVKKDISEVKRDVVEVKKDTRKIDKNLDTLAIITHKGFETVNKRLEILEKDHEDMMLKLSNVAYRFEFVALQKRVEFLEKKIGISQR